MTERTKPYPTQDCFQEGKKERIPVVTYLVYLFLYKVHTGTVTSHIYLNLTNVTFTGNYYVN